MGRIAEALLRGYKKGVSPLLKSGCVFRPTCSEYALTAVKIYGVAKGSLLAAKRILRCNRFACGGFDPVPLPLKRYQWVL